MQEASVNAHVAVSTLHNVRSICADLAPLSMPMDDQQLRQRARLIHGALRAREQMQALRDRAVRLAGALERFRQRRDEIEGRAYAVDRRRHADPRFVSGFNDQRRA
ncbi:hypothetical protein ACQQ2N_05290 [Dokdonella sp. MW10]|uniref:hypothetical protein n=1 Tax=Dokdonella sp. MW10 TaxID=2992926 RepID=UPI003F805DE1